MRLITVTAVIASLILSGCATTGSGGTPVAQTAMQRAQGKCLVAVAAGAILGAIIGNNTGNGNARRGAGAGAVAGVGICAVLLAMASEEDKRRIEEARYAALETGQAREDVYVGSDGKRRSINVRPEAAPDRTWTFAPSATDSTQPVSVQATPITMTDTCRSLHTSLAVQGTGTGDLEPELVCRNPRTRAWEVQRG